MTEPIDAYLWWLSRGIIWVSATGKEDGHFELVKMLDIEKITNNK
jgi:hypothetical protein